MTKRQKRDREYAIKSYLKGESITAIAMKLGYSQRWVYKWIQRYKENGEESDWQEDKTRRPHSNPRQLPDLVIEAVKQARASLIAEGLFLRSAGDQMGTRGRAMRAVAEPSDDQSKSSVAKG